MSNKGKSNNNSLCEKSIKMVTNMIKLSSFSIAKRSLGTYGPPPVAKSYESMKGGIAVSKNPLLPRYPSQRLQEPLNASKPIGYLIEPGEGNGSLRTICEEQTVDGKASDYIRRVHERNRYDLNEVSNFSTYIEPAPPRVVT